MALGNSIKAVYLSTWKGKLTQIFKQKELDTLHRVSKTGKDIHYKTYDFVSGQIEKIVYKVKEWEGKRLRSINIHLTDMDEKYVVTLGFLSNAAKCFFYHMENIDYSIPVRFEMSLYNDREYLFIKQNGERVARKYTRENPGDKPQWEKTIVRGEEQWDNSKELIYFKNILDEQINPKIEALNRRPATPAPAIQSNGLPNLDDIPDSAVIEEETAGDLLPF